MKKLPPVLFRVRAFSISRTRLSRNLEQGSAWDASRYFFGRGNNHPVVYQGSGLRSSCIVIVYNFLYQNRTQPAVVILL